MKKTLLSIIILCFAALTTFAQDDATPKLSAGFDIGAVTGPASNTYEEAAGVSLKLEVPVASSPLSLTVSAAYSGFITKGGFATGYDTYDGSYSYGSIASFVPLEVGARVYASKMFFLEGDVGASFSLNSQDVSGKSVGLIYAPIAGVSIPVRSSFIDVSLRYESRVVSNYNFDQIAVRAAFKFGLK